MSDGAKCDFCKRPAISLAGETNGLLACGQHVPLARDGDCNCDYWHSEHRWHCSTNYHHPDCYQMIGVPNYLPSGLCDCRVLRMIEADAEGTQ